MDIIPAEFNVTDYNAYVAWVRINNIPGREGVAISMIVNCCDDNVRFSSREISFLNPSRDQTDCIPGLIGSYPNYFFVIDAADLRDFFDILDNYNKSDSNI